jgi:hypothetical protein
MPVSLPALVLASAVALVLATEPPGSLHVRRLTGEGVEVGNWTELKDACEAGHQNVTLTADITVPNTSRQIEVNGRKACVINGQDKTVDLNQLGRFALVSDASSLEVRSLTLTGGVCKIESGEPKLCGGAVAAIQNSTLKFHSVDFLNNNFDDAAGLGGAICLKESKLTHCAGSFIGNTVPRYGGAIFAQKSKIFINTDPTFCAQTSTTTLSGSFAGVGGAVFADTTDVSITRADFHDNNATILDQFGGGAIFTSYADLRVSWSNFTNNIALSIINKLYGLGGAVFGYGLTEGTSLENCAFLNNGAVSGGAISIYGSQAEISKSSFKENSISSESDGGEGSTIYASGCKLNVKNATFETHEDKNKYHFKSYSLHMVGSVAEVIDSKLKEDQTLLVGFGSSLNFLRNDFALGDYSDETQYALTVDKDAADVRVEDSVFAANQQLKPALAVNVDSGGRVIFTDNQFTGNLRVQVHGSGGITAVTNNTFTNLQQLDQGGNSEYVYIKDNSFLNTSSNKEFNDCSLNQSNIEGIPRSKACGSTSCELESNDVRCICPGAGKKDEEEKNLQKIAGDLILVFTCPCKAKDGFSCAEVGIDLKDGFFNSALQPTGGAAIEDATSWGIQGGRVVDDSTTFQRCPKALGKDALEHCEVNKTTGQVKCLYNSAGPLCGTCKQGYYRKSEACIECTERQKKGGDLVLWVALGIICGIACQQLHRFAYLVEKSSFVSSIFSVFDVFGSSTILQKRLIVKFRSLLSCVQISGLLSSVYQISLPASLSSVLAVFDAISLDLSSLMGFQCIQMIATADKIMVVVTASTLIIIIFTVLAEAAIRRLPARLRCKTETQESLIAATDDVLVSLSFLLHPYFCSILFATYSCIPVNLGDEERRFLQSSMGVDCDNDSFHKFANGWAAAMIVLLPLGIPSCWLWRGWKQRSVKVTTETRTSGALEILFRGYKEDRWWWSVADCVYKLFVTGVAVLVMQGTVFQLQFAIIVTAIYLALFLLWDPFEEQTDKLLQTCFLLIILLIFMTSLMLQLLATDLKHGTLLGYNQTTVDILMLGSTSSLVILFMAFFTYDMHVNSQKPFFQFENGELVTLPPLGKFQFHLFLSHAQNKGQDQVAVVKAQLQHFLPSIRIFLDIDHLQEVHTLEALVESSRSVLLFLTTGCLCRHFVRTEIRTAVGYKRSIHVLRETDSRHGGVSLDVHKDDCPPDIKSAVFKEGEILWIRQAQFRIVAIKQIIQRLLLRIDGTSYLESKRAKYG